jgi:hypothetical protein
VATIRPRDDLVRCLHQPHGAAHLAWKLYQDQVEKLMATSLPFAQVEDAINRTDLRDDAKSALWLLAWSLREPAVAQQDARATLALIADHGVRHKGRHRHAR